MPSHLPVTQVTRSGSQQAPLPPVDRVRGVQVQSSPLNRVQPAEPRVQQRASRARQQIDPDDDGTRKQKKRRGPPLGGGELDEEVELPPSETGYEDYEYFEAGEDANEAADGSVFSDSGMDIDIERDTDPAARTWGGWRFTNVTVPQGATINRAIATLSVASGGSTEPHMDIYAEDVDDSASFTATPSLVTRTLTTASVAADDPTSEGEWSSPDLKDIVQEVVDRAGWASGNALTLLFVGRDEASSGTPEDGINFDSLEGGGVPSLTIFYGVN